MGHTFVRTFFFQTGVCIELTFGLWTWNHEYSEVFSFFLQMLKEVIVKRTFEIEKRLMEDVRALEEQVLALEEEKKTLQWDAKRLQLTLQEISSKHEKVCHHFE